jgi:4-aminobutyrate aminotransferase-like enzyme
LLALELGKPEYLYRLMEIFKEVGIMSDWFLYCDTAFRISPPLTISETEIEECCDLIWQALDRL